MPSHRVSACLILLLLGISLASSANAQQKRVLVVLQSSGEVATGLIRTSLERTLKGAPDVVELFTETFDFNRFSGVDHEKHVTEFLRGKYSGQPIDLVIAVGPGPLAFLARQRDALLPGVPIVFAAVREASLPDAEVLSNATGVISNFDVVGTLELALALQPNARQLFVISGASPLDVSWYALARKRLVAYEDRLRVTYLAGRPMSTVLNELSRIRGRNSIVILLSMIEDGEGTRFIPSLELVEALSAESSAPVYGVYETYVGSGVVGGYTDSFQALGAQAATLALRILAGERADNIAVERGERRVLVDRRELQRWKLDESKLPPGTVVRFSEPSLWERYRLQVTGVVGIVAFQAPMIAALVVQRLRRRRAETSLRESELQLKLMADTAPVMIWIAGVDRRFTFVNRVWLEFAGGSLEGELGRMWLERVHADELRRCRTVFDESFDQQHPFSVECRLRRHDGVYRWMLCNGVPRFSVDGAFAGFIGSCVDISEMREAESDLQRHRNELAHLNRVATLGEFTAAVTHELNQPLTAIFSNAQAAEMLLDDDPPAVESVREILADILNDDRRAAEIIRKMRRLLQRHEVVRTPVAINDVVDTAFHLVVIEAAARRVNMVFERADDDPTVLGDRVHLQQVILNLVLNAFEGMTVRSEDKRQITVMTRTCCEGEVLLAVSDTGTGVSKEMLPKLFEPFCTTKRDGLGLGLSITRSIVEAHRGRIWVENNADSGATFYVALPAASVREIDTALP